jgi:hypothetical protein
LPFFAPKRMNANPEKLPLSRGQIALRVAGGVLLTACAVMLVLGSTVLAKQLQGPRFLIYWTSCLLLTFIAMTIALWDMLLVRRISKRTRRELFRREFMNGDIADKLPRNEED